MKKKIILILVIVIALILLIPIPMKLKDGGSIRFQALLYNITKYHKLDSSTENGYVDGIGIEILGMEIFNNTKNPKTQTEISNNDNKEYNSFVGTVLEETTTFTRTYNILNVDESNEEKYLYLTIRQFQEEEVETVKVEKSIANNIERESNYEFTFQYTDNIVEDNIKSIFANTILISIKKTDKQGLEQIQDTIKYYKNNFSETENTIKYDENDFSEMENSYSNKFPKGITIYVGEEVNENLDETFGYNFEVLTDKEIIKNAREQFEQVLNKYPKGFWDELLLGGKCERQSLIICLVGELSNSSEVYSNPTGFTTYDSDTYYIFVDSKCAGPDANIEGTIFHELMHVIDFYLQDIGEQYSNWENYLPNGFEYTGYTHNHSESDFKMCMFNATDDNDVWFDGIYSTETTLEDRACMMASMYDNGLLYYKKYPHLYARMKYLHDILYKNFESIRNCEYDWLE